MTDPDPYRHLVTEADFDLDLPLPADEVCARLGDLLRDFGRLDEAASGFDAWERTAAGERALRLDASGFRLLCFRQPALVHPYGGVLRRPGSRPERTARHVNPHDLRLELVELARARLGETALAAIT